MTNNYISLHEWGKKLDPPVSYRRLIAIAHQYGEQLGIKRMRGDRGAFLIPEDAPDPRKWKPKEK